MAVLWESGNPGNVLQWEQTREAAQRAGVSAESWEAATGKDIEGAFDAGAAANAPALIVIGGPLTVANTQRIVDAANRIGVPALYANRGFVAAGGSMFYGANILSLAGRGATYVQAFLNGALPADLPIGRQVSPDFVINLPIANAIGFLFPDEVLGQATELIH